MSKKQKPIAGKIAISEQKFTIATAMSYIFQPHEGELNELASETMPNQTMSVQEMLKRHAKGLPLEGTNAIPIWETEDPLPDIANMDLADKEAIMDAVADRLVDLKQRIQAQKDSAVKKAEIDRIESLVQERLKQIQEEVKQKATGELPQ